MAAIRIGQIRKDDKREEEIKKDFEDLRKTAHDMVNHFKIEFTFFKFL